MARTESGVQDTARRALRAVVTGDIDAIEALYSVDVRLYNQCDQDAQRLAGIRERALLFASSLWNSTVTFGYCVQAGDVVVTSWEVEGLHKGWASIDTSPGHWAHLKGKSIMRIRDGRVVEDWSEFTSPVPDIDALTSEAMAEE